ncbi:MAG: ABC transporter ATP-binding protein/permease [Lachnospiraceae bacterium]|nr:ABC transporter ATP-binding protein/permease [Lachnospiraceae bacterium]
MELKQTYPLLVVGAIIGTVSAVLILAYTFVKEKKETTDFERTMKDSEIIKRLVSYAKPYWKQFLLVLFLMIFTISYAVLSPLIVGRIENLVAGDFALRALYGYVAAFALILVVSMVCSYFQAIILQKVGQRIISDMREELFLHIESFSHAQLTQIPVGKLVTRVTNDTNAISLMFNSLLLKLVKNSFVIVGILAGMLFLNFELTLMVLCFVPFIVLFTVVFQKFSRRAYRKVKDCTTDINTWLSENLSGIKVTQIFNREEAKNSEFAEKSRALGRARGEQVFCFGIFRPLIYMLYIASILCLLYLGGRGYIKGTTFLGQTITSGTIVSFYMYISNFFSPIQELAEQFNWLQSAFASAEKVFSLLDLPLEMTDDEDAIDLPEIRGEIEFKDVWFAYLPGEWVLKGASFHVKAGETAAFVGATGSGKTTILALLTRNYEFQKGEILIDGMDIRKIKTESLRRAFGQMLQDVFLFSGTIRSNIVLDCGGVSPKTDVSNGAKRSNCPGDSSRSGESGNVLRANGAEAGARGTTSGIDRLQQPTYSDEEIMEVCRYVNADRFINQLPHGLNEEVRERGSNFSAGQRQLLSFARTILHHPSVMILDEATANIDTETELLIQESLERMRSIGTMLIVAHRLSTIRHADQIFVVSHGEIIERGTHEELLEKQGRYYELYRMQEHRENLSGQ